MNLISMIKERYNSFKKKFSFLKWLDPFTYVEILLRKVHPKKENPSFFDEAVDSVVYVVSALIFAFLIYVALGLILNTSAPMVIVSSSSMVPEMYRGDIIVLYGDKNIKAREIDFNGFIRGKMYYEYGKTFPEPEEFIDPFTGRTLIKLSEAKEIQIGKERVPITKNGDIIVYFSSHAGKDIIHRAITKINARDGVFFITKGDANPLIDQDCIEVKNYYGEKVYSCISKYAVPLEGIKGKAVFKIPLLGCVKLWVFDDIPSLLLGKKLEFEGIC
jgi:signal peptidase I